MNGHILDHDAAGLARLMVSLSTEAQHELLVDAALFLAEKLSGMGEKTSDLLEALRSRRKLTVQEAGLAMELSATADDEYFRLREAGASEADWGSWFSQARLLRGIAVGFGASASEDVGDAIYELSRVFDDSGGLVEFIRAELTRRG